MDHHDEEDNVSKRRRIDNNDKANDDRLSALPVTIIADILALLPIETSVSTSVLSKEWRNLWTQLPSLKLSKNYGDHDFFAVANSVILKLFLSSLNPNAVRIFNIPTKNNYDDVDFFGVWLPLLCSRPSLKVLRMSVQITEEISNHSSSSSIPLPPCIFLCRSLVELTLSREFKCRLPDKDETISLPNLKLLQISLLLRDDRYLEMLSKLSTSCPSLEDLSVVEYTDVSMGEYVSVKGRCVAIAGKKLKRLQLIIYTPYVVERVTIDAPNLKRMNIVDESFASYCFAQKPGILGRAWLCLKLPDNPRFGWRNEMLDHVRSLSNVRTLLLSYPTLHVLGHIGENDLPVLENLRSVEFPLLSHPCFRTVIRYLNRCRNIEAVTLRCFRGSIDVIQPLDCLLKKVKIIKICWRKLENYDENLVLVKYILTNAQALELLYFYMQKSLEDLNEQEFKEQEFCEEVIKKFSSSFVHCRIVFSGKYVKMSCKGGQIDGLSCDNPRLGKPLQARPT